MVEIRKAVKNDAEQIISVMKNAEASGFMLFDLGERKVVVESFATFIKTVNQNEKSGIFIADEKDRIVGYLIVQGEKHKWTSHRAYIAVGIHSDSRRKGVGRALFLHVIDWAEKVGLHRLDLTVLTDDNATVDLYKKMGFIIEGINRDSLMINGAYVDEYYMAKLI